MRYSNCTSGAPSTHATLPTDCFGNTQSKRRRKSSIHDTNPKNCCRDTGHLNADKDVYSVGNEIEPGWAAAQWAELIETRDDENGRICRLKIPSNLSVGMVSLPTSLRWLTRLTHLDLSNCTNLKHLPPFLGELDRLESLCLAGTKELRALPQEIGNLSNLRTLSLKNSGITSLPSCIGRLQNLRQLDLSFTVQLSALPKEIGHLSNLERLDLRHSGIASIPPSVGWLTNLTHLNLSCTQNLEQLPEEIGDLVSLTWWSLNDSAIRSIPPSVGRLQNLENLFLGWTKNLMHLPNEIGSVTNLKYLSLERSGIASLPDSVQRLTELMYLNVHGSCRPHLKDKRDWIEFLLGVTNQCQSLGCLVGERNVSRTELGWALARNRAKFRTRCLRTTPQLWPHVLSRAAVPLWSYPKPDGTPNATKVSRVTFRSQTPDAIYQQLLDNRESFIGVLLDRAAKGRISQL